MILASVLLGLSLFPFSEYESPPVVLTMMFMLVHVLISPEYLSSVPYFSTHINSTFLSCFINVVTGKFGMSRYGCLLMGRNPRRYEVA